MALYASGRGFSRSKAIPRSNNSRQRHSRYDDSSKPGPSCRCTSIAAPITSPVMRFSWVMVLFIGWECPFNEFHHRGTEFTPRHRFSVPLCDLRVSVVDMVLIRFYQIEMRAISYPECATGYSKYSPARLVDTSTQLARARL